jgi:hypothetical protein
MHPEFFHRYKRVTMAFFLSCVVPVIEQGRSPAAVAARCNGSTRWSIKRWTQGFCAGNIRQKALCFYGSTYAIDSNPGRFLIDHFRKMGQGDAVKGVIVGLLILWDRFLKPLY